MTDSVFVDTNILVYAWDADEVQKRQLATQALSRLWQERTGRTSMQVLGEYYVTLTRKLKPGVKPEEAWSDIQALMAWEPQPIDRELLVRAHEIERRYRTSWWDGMVVAAAQMQSCAILLSEDFQDGMVFDQVTVRNPFLARVEEQRTAYRIPVKLRPRHRSRGRPAKIAV